MKTVLLFIFGGLLPVLGLPQSVQRPETVPLQQAKNFLLPDKAVSAEQQANSWAFETRENPQNANAWLNYALWTQRNTRLSATQKLARLKEIGNAATQNIPATAEMDIIRFLESGKTDSAAIASAMSKNIDRGLVYPLAIQNAIIRQDRKSLTLYCNAYQGWSAVNTQSAFYRYHANVLRSAPDSAIIAAMGENDLVPMAILQQVLNMRPDVRLVYYSPTVIEQYKNVYLCLSLGETVLQQYKDASFCGLLLNISGKKVEGNPGNILPAGIDLDYLQTGNFDLQTAQLNNNYLPALLLAYRYHKKNGSAEAERYKQLIIKIAREGGKENTILPLLGKE